MDKENEIASNSSKHEENGTIQKKSNNNHNDDGKVNEEEEERPLYFSKTGKPQFGVTAPTAFVVSYPYPPLPSNLGKNRVLRPQDDQSKESLREGIIEAEKAFEKEAMPLPNLSKVQGSPLKKVLIPEIELAIYWDRHAYEFRPFGMVVDKSPRSSEEQGINNNNSGGNSSIRRSKSEMNLASQVGEIIQEDNRSIVSRRSSASAASKSLRASASSLSGTSSFKHFSLEKERKTQTLKDNHTQEHSPTPSIADNGPTNRRNSIASSNNKSGETNSNKGTSRQSHNDEGGSILGKQPSQGMPMTGSERRKFEDIKHSRQNNYDKYQSEEGYMVLNSRPKVKRSNEQLQQMEALRKSAGVQVTLEDVTTAALKSTYLCPLHGQYQKGIQRRDKGGFRTDMRSSSSVANAHTNCSRALKGVRSRTKMIKSAETQTDDDEASVKPSAKIQTKRSKTAVLARNLNSKLKDVMASEYHGSFRDPYKIADTEKRHLRNKILNYCFTKHSIF